MSHELFITSSKHPKVSSSSYLIDASEPPDYLSHDIVRELEPRLIENSSFMKRRFRLLAQNLRSRYAAKQVAIESTLRDGYLDKFSSNERMRIINQLKETREADELELSKINSYVFEHKQMANMKRQKRGLSPIL